MKVLVISEHYFPIVGGSTTYVYNLCKNTASLNCEVYLVTIPNDENPVLEWYKDNNFNVYRLKIPKILRKERYFPYFLWKQLKGIIKDVDPDIIHFGHGFFAPLISKWTFRKPVVWTVQNIPPAEHGLNIPFPILGRIYLFLADIYGRFALRVSHYDRLICVSKITAKSAIEKGVPPDKIEIISDGIDPESFIQKDRNQIRDKLGIKKERLVILTVAGIIPHKGLDYLVKAADEVVKKYPNALFLIIGPVRSEGYFREIKKKIQNLGLSKNVEIIPGVNHLEVYDYYRIADVYLQPSLQEGFCISILEAMAAGRPAIGTKTGAIPQMLNESKGGLLIEPGNSKQIVKALVRLLADPVERKNKGLKARKYVINNYSWEKIAKKTLGLYQGIIRR